MKAAAEEEDEEEEVQEDVNMIIRRKKIRLFMSKYQTKNKFINFYLVY